MTESTLPRFLIGQLVRCSAGIGTVEFVARSSAMACHLYTVAFDTRVKLRVLESELTEVTAS
jgi:hypothetical protein